MKLELKQNSIFISDAHFNSQRRELLGFLCWVETQNFSQIFFMGDIFDFLSGESSFFMQENIELINLINKLSARFEVYYFEGNHDFNLKNVFINLTIFSREKQPAIFEFYNQKIALSHGDNFIGIGYDIFSQIIRNHLFLKFLNFIDFGFWLSKKIQKHLESKNICAKYKINKHTILSKINNIDADIISEGHFHQDFSQQIEGKTYINFPAFACNKKICEFRDGKFTSLNITFN